MEPNSDGIELTATLKPSEIADSLQDDSDRWELGCIKEKLDEARVNGRWLRRLVRGPPLLFGLVSWCAGVMCFLRALTFDLSNQSWRDKLFSHIATSCFLCTAASLSLALLPTDRRAVRAVMIMIICGLHLIASCSAVWAYESYCKLVKGDVTNEPFARLIERFTFFAFMFVLSCVEIFTALRATLNLPVGELLEFLFKFVSTFALAGGCLFGVTSISSGVLAVLGIERPWRWCNDAMFALEWLAAGSFYLCGKGFRQRVQTFFASTGDAYNAAAGIASLVGGLQPERVIQKARSRCRTVAMDLVKKEDFSANDPVQNGLGLNQYTREASIGEIDAFISHSWHDDAEAKWSALQCWRSDFKSRHSREANAWIDKYCIDQNNVTEDLQCLPVFLAGSRQFVILHGCTYLNRLWCIMELLTFVHMGGTWDEMSMRKIKIDVAEESDDWPLQSTSTLQLQAEICQFSVRNATCVKPTDKDMLFAIVEAGFGGPGRFDRVIKDMLWQVEQRASTR